MQKRPKDLACAIAQTEALHAFGFDLFVEFCERPGGGRIIGQLLELFVQLHQFFVGELLQPHERFARAFCGIDKLVKLELNGFSVAVLGILNKKHHKERDDGRACIDHQLPRIREIE